MHNSRRRAWGRSRLGLTTALTLTLVTAAVMAQPPLLRFDWAERQRAGKVATGKVLAHDGPGGAAALRIHNDGKAPKRATLLIVDAPDIQQLRWRMSGQVRYEDVAGQAYLELLNVLPSGAFFTRSLAPEGPLGELTGSSDWRPFVLPFDASRGGQPPDKLLLSVVLPSRGTVDIGPVELCEGGGSYGAAPAAWWGDRTAGWLFGGLGALLGCFGGLLGTLAGVGRARRWVRSGFVGAAALSAGALGAGAWAWTAGQPHQVFYPLLLLGVVGMAAFGVGYRLARRHNRHCNRALRNAASQNAHGS